MTNDQETTEMMPRKTLESVLPDLTKPFPASDIKWRIQKVTNNGKGIAVPYLDSRNIQERLDEVVPGDWEISFRREALEGTGIVAGNIVYARLTILGVSREEVGSSYITTYKGEVPEKINENKIDPKTATSDSMKRVAGMFGIGRYLWKFDKVVFLDDAKQRFGFSAPTTADIPDQYHRYLEQLAVESQIHPERQTKNTLDVLQFILKRITDGESTAEDALQYLESNQAKALSSIMKSMEKAKKT